jgi:F-type H+-transporting ATPase subunit gamma
MASAREIKRRMKSVKNIMQVTRALEAVSASKVRRATNQVLASRAYSDLALTLLNNVAAASKSESSLHPLLTPRESKGTIAVILITSDRGLAGAYNSNIIRVARNFAHRMGRPVRWIAVGKKGRDALVRSKENLIAEFTALPAFLKFNDITPIARVAMDEFLNGTVDEVFIAYTDFVNTLAQKPRVQRMLPLSSTENPLPDAEYMKIKAAPTTKVADYIYEPSPEGILEEIVPRFTQLVVFQAILEALASEHSARMVTMRNASENASTLVDALTLAYNKARQLSITGEILDIVGGVEALNKA